jgi:hypothetical protein
MLGKPVKPSQFWKEPKRRKLIRVIAMYAGAAIIIIMDWTWSRVKILP